MTCRALGFEAWITLVLHHHYQNPPCLSHSSDWEHSLYLQHRYLCIKWEKTAYRVCLVLSVPKREEWPVSGRAVGNSRASWLEPDVFKFCKNPETPPWNALYSMWRRRGWWTTLILRLLSLSLILVGKTGDWWTEILQSWMCRGYNAQPDAW